MFLSDPAKRLEAEQTLRDSVNKDSVYNYNSYEVLTGLGYVHELPLWNSNTRLYLSDDDDNDKNR